MYTTVITRAAAIRPEHNMLQSLPTILFSNSQKPSLLFFQFLPIILKFLPVILILCKQKMKPHTVVQQKSHCTCRKGVITGDSSLISVLDELRLLELKLRELHRHSYMLTTWFVHLHLYHSFTPLPLFRNYARCSCVPIMPEIMPAYCAQA